MIAEGGPDHSIGMSKIKERRLTKIEVPCHPNTYVGEYVPFYYCPRSVMLYLMYRGNHPELDYDGGQKPILHLEIDLHEAINWANESGIRWALSFSNAGAYHAEFGCGKKDLRRLDWAAIAATDFRDPDVKENKQAEFLIHGFVPFGLVRRIGVNNWRIHRQVTERLDQYSSIHRPVVEVIPEWYY